MNDPRSALLRAVNDRTDVHPYGDGFLVDSPFAYSDGDTVRLLVEPVNTGYRVTDRADVRDRLETLGIRADSGRASNAIRALIDSAGLNQIATVDEREIATYGDVEQLGDMILAVAQTVLQLESLRWLAVDQPEVRFDKRVARRITSASANRWRMDRPELILKSGDSRRITTSVVGRHGRAFVQAVGSADPLTSVEHCFFVFDRAAVEPSRLVAALEGSETTWRRSLIDDLEEVGRIAFFDDPIGLERELQQIVDTNAPNLTA